MIVHLSACYSLMFILLLKIKGPGKPISTDMTVFWSSGSLLEDMSPKIHIHTHIQFQNSYCMLNNVVYYLHMMQLYHLTF